jgi:hypothetical protein
MHIRYNVLIVGDIGARRGIWMLSTTKVESTVGAEEPDAEVSLDNSAAGGLTVYGFVGAGLVAVVGRGAAKVDV